MFKMHRQHFLCSSWNVQKQSGVEKLIANDVNFGLVRHDVDHITITWEVPHYRGEFIQKWKWLKLACADHANVQQKVSKQMLDIQKGKT